MFLVRFGCSPSFRHGDEYIEKSEQSDIFGTSPTPANRSDRSLWRRLRRRNEVISRQIFWWPSTRRGLQLAVNPPPIYRHRPHHLWPSQSLLGSLLVVVFVCILWVMNCQQQLGYYICNYVLYYIKVLCRRIGFILITIWLLYCYMSDTVLWLLSDASFNQLKNN